MGRIVVTKYFAKTTIFFAVALVVQALASPTLHDIVVYEVVSQN